jgi:hypothetical protein
VRRTKTEGSSPSGGVCYYCTIMSSRKKRSGSTVTLSVSLNPKDVAIFRKRARRLHGGNVSAAIGDAAELLRIEENRQAFAARLEEELGPLDPAVERAILLETMGVSPPVRRKKRKVA